MGNTQARLLGIKTMGEFDVLDNPAGLMDAHEDSILLLGETGTRTRPYLNDFGDRAYVLSLPDAALIPRNAMVAAPTKPPDHHGLPEGFQYNPVAPLLLNKSLAVISDSFARHRINPAIRPGVNGGWTIDMPVIEQQIDEPCFFIDSVFNHFGHALIDTSAHLWALMDRYNLKLSGIRFVGFPLFGLSGDSAKWPTWLKVLLKGYGIPLDRLTIIRQPTRIRQLIVPKRISPFITGGGIQYNQFMQSAGDRLVAGLHPKVPYAPRIFLSRSRVNGGRRPMRADAERRLDDLFSSRGYQILHPQEMTMAEQIFAVRNATHIAGCQGSQMLLTSFCNQLNVKFLRLAPAFLADKEILDLIARFSGYEAITHIINTPGDDNAPPNLRAWTIEGPEWEQLDAFVGRHSS